MELSEVSCAVYNLRSCELQSKIHLIVLIPLSSQQGHKMLSVGGGLLIY